jgi:hypothetical protein
MALFGTVVGTRNLIKNKYRCALERDVVLLSMASNNAALPGPASPLFALFQVCSF